MSATNEPLYGAAARRMRDDLTAAADRVSIAYARRILADSKAADFGQMDTTDLLCMVGSLQSAVSILLRVVDQDEEAGQ